MGLQQSKDELLYQQVSHANIEAVKKLRSEGAGLEWTDKEGKTPLILASTNPQLFDVAKTLTELGANVNAYRPGHHAGTPLHHAAQSGLVQMVNLLLSHGANALVMNDDCQTALDVARLQGNGNVVLAIESHICLFSGWLHEVCEPGFLGLRAPKPKKVWVVIVPCGARKQSKPLRWELAIYSSLQDGKPCTIMRLWKVNMDESNLDQPNPTVIISSSKIPKRWRRKRSIGHSQVKQSRIKLAPVNENEKPQFKQFCNACKGTTQVMQPALPFNNQVSNTEPPAQTTRDPELPLPINASLQSGSEVGPTAPISYYPNLETGIYSQVVPTAPIIMSAPPTVPSAPLLPETVDGPVHYPSIDSSPNDGEKDINDNDSSSCVICLDAPVEGACIPCGHMAGCMVCLNEIKGKDWGCPVCRAKIEQVVRLYAV